MAKDITIKDVARLAGVSSMTVSRVLNNRPDVSPKTRQHVQFIIEELGYAPNEIARSLSQGRSNTIGVVSSALELYGPSRTLVGIEKQANEFGFSLMVRLLHDTLADSGFGALNELLANHVAGIIWAVAEMGEQREWLYEQRGSLDTPLVFLSAQSRPGVSSVAIDNFQGGRLAAGHLLEQGYQEIGIISGPLEWWESRQRERGWQAVLEEGGHRNLNRVKEQGDWTAASGYQAMMRLLDKAPDCDAVFVANDSMALGALRAAASRGRSVPEDLAIVGFDDIPESAYFSPPLTTIRQDLMMVGCEAVTHLHQHLRQIDRDVPYSAEMTMLEPELVVRKSSIRNSL